jgi:tRNA pseudouridine38-40 synthase
MAQVARPQVREKRYRAVVAYDGTHYYGFQRQAGDTPTIQGALEHALERVTRQAIPVTGAGRTDSGVHATGQVIAFEAAWRHPTQALCRALNANLPDDIALQSLDEAHADFHPRFDARSRKYAYTLYVAPIRQPLLNNFAWHVPTRQPLDVAHMQQAADMLVGTHDFATFGTPPQGDNTVRTVMQSVFETLPGTQLSVSGEPEVQVLRYTIEANAFLYRMVRRTVGTLVRVGIGHLSLAAFEAAFRAADGDRAEQTAPARGLCLVSVNY